MNIDWFTFAAQIVNFIVLVYLLSHFLYEPVLGAMNKRELAIASRLSDAEQRELEADSELQKYQTLTDRIEHEQKELMDQARTDSEQVRQKLVAEARNDVQLRREDWLESLHREQAALVRLFRQRAGQQVVDVSRNVLSQLADVDLEQRSLEIFVGQLKEISDIEKTRLKQEFAEASQTQVHTAFTVSKEWQQRIEMALGHELGLQNVTFVTTSELICGIELHVGGMKIGWSVQEYLELLTDELENLLVKQ